MQEIGGVVPPWGDCPPDIRDFPAIVHSALEIFELLSDEYLISPQGEMRYKGKNKLELPLLFDSFYIEDKADKIFIMELLGIMDVRARKKLNKK